MWGGSKGFCAGCVGFCVVGGKLDRMSVGMMFWGVPRVFGGRL